ncbi:O-antigen ligase family protein [Mariprofundus sp. EBB-1]|uniref:O-antigen ligase family protein n=1 Tax=Mariprofundus sp. EBB-1 TaxID=2650971 RepID=UPI000EF25E3A|nr:O-antigen ligase family protein [Mariprofundus sp. EBB-1]RLL55876.1 O-antigen ligase family protein [Mariprofundus sp. EBB-1]
MSLNILKRFPMLWVVVMTTGMALVFGDVNIAGIQLSGLAWVICVVLSLLQIIISRGKTFFPIRIWFPWILVVLIYVLVSEDPNALQRSLMLICPILVGMAIASKPVSRNEVRWFFSSIKYLGVTLLLVIALKTGFLLTGNMATFGHAAAEVTFASFLAAFFIVKYVAGEKKMIYWWGVTPLIPLLAYTRAAMFVALISLPLTLAPLGKRKRIVIACLILAIGTAVFYTDRFQQRMFYTGHGTISDVFSGSSDINTSGRTYMWDMMMYEIDKKPLLGHGANASETFLLSFTKMTHPHNDYVRILFDYGILGLLVFLTCLSVQAIDSYKKAKKYSGDKSTLFYLGSSAFILFLLFMFTDNIVMYAAFFGNMHFASLGLAYSASRTKMNTANDRLLYARG